MTYPSTPEERRDCAKRLREQATRLCIPGPHDGDLEERVLVIMQLEDQAAIYEGIDKWEAA